MKTHSAEDTRLPPLLLLITVILVALLEVLEDRHLWSIGLWRESASGPVPLMRTPSISLGETGLLLLTLATFALGAITLRRRLSSFAPMAWTLANLILLTGYWAYLLARYSS